MSKVDKQGGAKTGEEQSQDEQSGVQLKGQQRDSQSDLQQHQTVDLNKDYNVIAQLLANIDNQSEHFSNKMNQILETTPAHDGLATLWEDQAEALRNGNNSQTVASPKKWDDKKTSGQSGINYMIDDEANDDPNDTIILL